MMSVANALLIEEPEGSENVSLLRDSMHIKVGFPTANSEEINLDNDLLETLANNRSVIDDGYPTVNPGKNKFRNTATSSTDTELNTNKTGVQQSNDIKTEEFDGQCRDEQGQNFQNNVNCIVDGVANPVPENLVNSNDATLSGDDPLSGNKELADNRTGADDKPYRCHICGKLFSRNSSLKCHIRLHIEGPENILRSSTSGNDSAGSVRESDGPELDRKEQDEIGEETQYSCIFCDKYFARKSGLKCHIQFHIEAFRTESANGALAEGDENETVLRKSSSEIEDSPQTSSSKEYTCVICDQQFSRKSSLIMHYRNHPITTMDVEEQEADQFCRKFTIDIKQERVGINEARKCSISSEKDTITPVRGDQSLEDGAEGEDKQYKCYICDKQFARNSSLAWHIQFHETHMYTKLKKSNDACLENGVKNTNDSHVECDEFKCPVCGKVYFSNSNLRRHMVCHGELAIVNGDAMIEESPVSKEATCELCGRTFKNITSLKKHFVQIHKGQQMHHPVEHAPRVADESTGEFKCDLCDKSYLALTSLKRHILTNHQPVEHSSTSADKTTSYKCDQCPKLFDSPRAKNIHIAHGHRATAAEKLVQPKATSENVLDESSFVMNEDGMYQCRFCDRTFDRKQTLSRHIESQHIDDCDNSDIDLTLDEDIEDQSLGTFDCPHCDRVFENKKGLSRHIGYHNSMTNQLANRGPTVCKYCNKNFDSVRAMRIHAAHAHRDQISDDVNSQSESEIEVVESGQFECPHCDRVFDSKRARSSHTSQAHKPTENHSQRFDSEMEAEAEESSRFKCFKCSRVFDSKRARSSHAAQAHRPSDYQDSQSEYETEDEEDPEQYECPHCDRVFDSKRARSSHTSQAHKPPAESDADLFRCAYCKRFFDSARAMNIHAAAQHKEQVIAAKALLSSQSKKDEDSDTEHTDLSDAVSGQQSDDKQWYPCTECPKVFGHPKSLSRHVRDHKLERDHPENDLWPRVKIQESPVVKGRLEENGTMKCGLCAKPFVNVKALAGHMKIHSKGVHDSPSTESIAPLISPTFDEAVYIDDSSKIYTCRICDKTFTTGFGLGGHMRIHSGTMTRAEMSDENAIFVKKEHSAAESEDEEVVYSCDICKESFSSKQQLGKHMKNHLLGNIGSADSGDEAFRCKSCGRQFNGEKSLKTHTYRFHRELIQTKRPTKFPNPVKMNGVEDNLGFDTKYYKCDRCGRMYSNYRAYKSHRVYNCHDDRKRPHIFDSLEPNVPGDLFKCEYCDQSFLLRCHLQKHLKSRCNAIDLKSDLTTERDGVDMPSPGVDMPLPSKRPRRSTFVDQLYEYDPIGSFKCDECGKTFSSKQNWQRHLVTHKAAAQKIENSETASKLTFSFRKNGELVPQRQPNLEAQFREMPYECVYCEKCFKEKELLLDHVRMHAEANELDGQELNEDDINFHAGEHFVIENSEGDEEHFIFEQHEDSEGYQCTECEDNYKDKLQMIIHMSYHLNSKLPPEEQKSLMIKADSKLLAPYACRFCNQRFISKRYRINHLRAHHQDDVYQCDVCQKMFLYKSNLQSHCRQHIIDTRHRCEYCRKYFSSPWFLLRHTKIVHGKRSCKNCGFQS